MGVSVKLSSSRLCTFFRWWKLVSFELFLGGGSKWFELEGGFIHLLGNGGLELYKLSS